MSTTNDQTKLRLLNDCGVVDEDKDIIEEVEADLKGTDIEKELKDILADNRPKIKVVKNPTIID